MGTRQKLARRIVIKLEKQNLVFNSRFHFTKFSTRTVAPTRHGAFNADSVKWVFHKNKGSSWPSTKTKLFAKISNTNY